MKAAICDFCGVLVPDVDQTAMIFEVSIKPANGRAASRPTDKSALFDAGDVCHLCAKTVKKALVGLMRELRAKRVRT
jgi:hypothetical protein